MNFIFVQQYFQVCLEFQSGGDGFDFQFSLLRHNSPRFLKWDEGRSVLAVHDSHPACSGSPVMTGGLTARAISSPLHPGSFYYVNAIFSPVSPDV